MSQNLWLIEIKMRLPEALIWIIDNGFCVLKKKLAF